jgi:hypothetical protein
MLSALSCLAAGCVLLQAAANGLDELEVEHRKLSQLADKAKTLRAQNAQMAGEVANLPELKKAAADLQQQVVQMQHVRQQIQRLQVGSQQARGCSRTAVLYWCVLSKSFILSLHWNAAGVVHTLEGPLGPRKVKTKCVTQKMCVVTLLQAEGEAAYADVQHATPHSADRQQGGSTGTPGPRLSAAHIATTPPHAAAAAAGAAGAALRTPHPAEVSRALLSQAETPVTAAAQLSAQLAVSPSVLTPGVAQAMADAGEAVAAAQGHEATANLDKIKAKLAVLKQHIGAKTKRMSDEKRRQIEAQIEKLEKSLAYVEKQRVSFPWSLQAGRLAGACMRGCDDTCSSMAAMQMQQDVGTTGSSD